MTAEAGYDPESARREALENGTGLSAYDIDGMMGKRALTAFHSGPRREPARRRSTGSVRGFYDGELRDGEDPSLLRGPELTELEKSQSDAALKDLKDGPLKQLRIAELERKSRLMFPDDPNNVARVLEDRKRYIRAAIVSQNRAR